MDKKYVDRPCIYCGGQKGRKKYLIQPDKEQQIYCCGLECYNKTREFIAWDKRNRIKAYLLIAPCVIFNLVSMGLEWTFRWRYLSLTLIGLILYFYPLVFTRYATYERYGVQRTLNIIKVVSVGIILFSFLLLLWG